MAMLIAILLQSANVAASRGCPARVGAVVGSRRRLVYQ